MSLKDLISYLCQTYYFEARASPDQLPELLRLREIYQKIIDLEIDLLYNEVEIYEKMGSCGNQK